MFSEVQESISENTSTLTTSLTLTTGPTSLSAVTLTEPKLLYTSPNTAVLTPKGQSSFHDMKVSRDKHNWGRGAWTPDNLRNDFRSVVKNYTFRPCVRHSMRQFETYTSCHYTLQPYHSYSMDARRCKAERCSFFVSVYRRLLSVCGGGGGELLYGSSPFCSSQS